MIALAFASPTSCEGNAGAAAPHYMGHGRS